MAYWDRYVQLVSLLIFHSSCQNITKFDCKTMRRLGYTLCENWASSVISRKNNRTFRTMRKINRILSTCFEKAIMLLLEYLTNLATLTCFRETISWIPRTYYSCSYCTHILVFFRNCHAVLSRDLSICCNSTCPGWHNSKSWPAFFPVFKTATKCSRCAEAPSACGAFSKEKRNIFPCDRVFVPITTFGGTPPLRH